MTTIAASPMQQFNPLMHGVNFSSTPGISTVSSNVASAVTPTTPTPLSGAGDVGMGALNLGVAAFQFVNTVGAINGSKRAVMAQAEQARNVARDNNAQEVFKIEITAFRHLKTMTAQAAAGGFASGSQSTLKIKNQQQNDADRLEIQSNKRLDDTLREIQRQESQALKQLSSARTGAIMKLGLTAVGAFAAPFTGGASLVLAGGANV